MSVDASRGVASFVPADRWRLVRLALFVVYGLAYAISFVRNGIIIDRVSVVISVVILLVIGQVGRPWYRWRQLASALVLYIAMWLAYDETRGAADRLGMPLQVESVRNIDRALFLGADPTVWLQRRFLSSDTVRWYDVAASVVYATHFVLPVAVLAVLWLADRHQWVRLMRRLATVLLIACLSFVLLPTAPPWMAAGGDRQIRLDALAPVVRPTGRGWSHLGLESFEATWETGRDWANRIAAMPSLVYLAEHWVVDVVAGWAVVGAAFAVWATIEHRLRQRRAATSRRALLPLVDNRAPTPGALAAGS